jgi:hypothetical protein
MNTLFHTPGRGLVRLEIGTPLRSLDQGRSKPILFELDGPDGPAPWVVKPRCLDRRGGAGLLCEVAAADVASLLAVLVPEMGLLSFPSPPLDTEVTELGVRVGEVYRRDEGHLAFCSRYTQGAVPVVEGLFDDLRSVPAAMQADAVRTFALDVWLRHYDRAASNPNLLALEDRLVAIDHGLAFYGVEQIRDDGLSRFEDVDTDGPKLASHVCAPLVARGRHDALLDEIAVQIGAIGDARLDQLASTWPDTLDGSPPARPSGMRSSLLRALRARRDAFPSLLRSVRACLSS